MEQMTPSPESFRDRESGALLWHPTYPLGLIQSVPSDYLAEWRNGHIMRTLRDAGVVPTNNRVSDEDLLAAYERLASRSA